MNFHPLTNDATTGRDTLEGHEEDLTTRSHKVTIQRRRHAVVVGMVDEQFSAIGLRNAAKPSLKTWANEDTRDRIIGAMGSVNGVAYGSASEAEKDAWLVDNADRVLFGAAKVNAVSNDHSVALATVDSTNDVLKRGALSLLKRIALLAQPKIRPLKDPGNGKRTLISYVHPYVMRDLRADMEAVLDDTTATGEAMRLFEGGDLYWDGIIVKELDDMPILTGVGNGGIDVSPVYMIGAQAIGHAKCSGWKTVERNFDYGEKVGVSIGVFDNYEKLRFGSGAGDTDDTKDFGIATGFFAAVAD